MTALNSPQRATRVAQLKTTIDNTRVASTPVNWNQTQNRCAYLFSFVSHRWRWMWRDWHSPRNGCDRRHRATLHVRRINSHRLNQSLPYRSRLLPPLSRRWLQAKSMVSYRSIDFLIFLFQYVFFSLCFSAFGSAPLSVIDLDKFVEFVASDLHASVTYKQRFVQILFT